MVRFEAFIASGKSKGKISLCLQVLAVYDLSRLCHVFAGQLLPCIYSPSCLVIHLTAARLVALRSLSCVSVGKISLGWKKTRFVRFIPDYCRVLDSSSLPRAPQSGRHLRISVSNTALAGWERFDAPRNMTMVFYWGLGARPYR